MPLTYTELKQALHNQPLPSAFVDLQALEHNRQWVLQQAGGGPVRIATKSIRCRAVLELLAQSPTFQGWMCYTAAEAVWLAKNGFDNLLIGYPSTDIQAIAEIATLVAQGKRIYLMIDNSEQARLLEPLAAQAGALLPLCLDLDMSSDLPGLHFGVWRSSLRKVADVERLLRLLQPLRHVRVAALMGYEAQIAGLGDKLPGQVLKNRVVRALQSYSAEQVFARRQAAVDLLERAGCQLDFVNGGGTGSLKWTAQDRSVTELTAGSAFFAPGLFDHYSRFQLQPAAGFALPVVRQPAADIYTCLGGGYIASGSTGPEKQPVLWLPEGAELLAQEGAGEVQTPVRYRGQPLGLGDPIALRHAKAGELCERFNQLLLLRDGQVQQVVPTYRGEGQCFL